MVEIAYSPNFTKLIQKIKDNALKEKVKSQLRKLLENPEAGKPTNSTVLGRNVANRARKRRGFAQLAMKYARKGTMELYIPPFRLSYAYLKDEDKLVILDLYHKDRQ